MPRFMSLLLMLVSVSLCAIDDDAKRVLDTIREEVLAGAPSASSVDKYLSGLQPDGSWKDVNYADRTRSGFDPSKHMDRVKMLAQDGARAGWDSERGKTMGDAVKRCLEYWFTVKPKSDNWWHQTIGIPQILGPALLLCAEVLPDDLRNTAFESMRAAGKEQEKFTGANRTWVANNNLILGLMTGDDDLVKLALTALTEEVRMTTDEGLQPDWSFHQHGPMLQTGNYGNAWLSTQIKLARQLQGTRWAYPPEKIALLSGYTIEHSQWPLWGQWFDLSACGRQLDGPRSAYSKGRGLAGSARALSAVDAGRSNELNAVYLRYAATNTAAEPFGARYFWRSEYLVQRTQSWFASLKLMSSRVMRIETTVNDENKMGLHLSDGVTWFRIRGDEQEDLQPLLDWRRLPGVTGRDIAEPVKQKSKDDYKNGGNGWVGGAVYKTAAVIAMDFKREPVTARKAWFFRPWGMIALGAGIEDSGNGPLFTGVNQMFLRGDVSIWNPGRTTASGEVTGDVRAVWHAGIAYLFGPGQDMHLTIRQVTGKWTDLKTTGTKDTAAGSVVRMHLAHDAGKTGSYEYAVLPLPDAVNVEQRVQVPLWKTLSNDPSLQAVVDAVDGSISAVFWKNGTVTSGEMEVRSEEPCVLMLSKESNGMLLSAADPGHTLSELHISLRGLWKGSGAAAEGEWTKITVGLPGEGMAGSTTNIRVEGK